MTNKLTSAELIVKPLQYLEETVEGVIDSTGDFIAVGVNSMISIKKDGQWVEVPQLSAEDLEGLIEGPQKYQFQIKYNPLDSNFLKYGVNAADPASPSGTISKSLTMLFSVYFNGTEKYIIITGLRPNQTQIDLETGKPIAITVDCVSMMIGAPAAMPSGVTLVDTPLTGSVWSWLTGGTGQVAYNSVSQDCKKFSITINRNAKEEYTLGDDNPGWILPHARKIAFSGDFLWDGVSTFEADQAAGTPQTIAVVLLTSTSTLTLTSAQVTNYNRSHDIGSSMATVESITGKAISVAVT